jgi:putative intracellular protease/amidase
LPGGNGHLKFNEHFAPKLVQFCKKNMNNTKITFMSMCASTKCYADYGMLENKNIKVTGYPGTQEGKYDKNYVDKSTVSSANFITSQGPGTTIEFALEVVKQKVGAKAVNDLTKRMLIK